MKRTSKLVSTTPKIQVIDNMLTGEQMMMLQATNNDLTYGWKSDDSNPNDPGHWNKVIVGSDRQLANSVDVQGDIEFVTSDIFPIWEQVQMASGKRDLLRCYFNGYTYGTEGYTHVDATAKLTNYPEDKWAQETVLIYCSPQSDWNSDWAGETVFFSKDKKEVIFSSLPHSHRAVVFDAFTPHAARSVSRAYKGLRKILVFKTVKFKFDEEQCLAFIKERFDGIDHSGSSFYSHLFNTYQILKGMHMPQDVCIAALFHSVYGTEYFKPNRTVSRTEVESLVGKYVEDLVYTFCTLTNRIQTICKNAQQFNKIKHYHLACIEYANLIEQQPRTPIPDFGKTIKELRTIIES